MSFDLETDFLILECFKVKINKKNMSKDFGVELKIPDFEVGFNLYRSKSKNRKRRQIFKFLGSGLLFEVKLTFICSFLKLIKDFI